MTALNYTDRNNDIVNAIINGQSRKEVAARFSLSVSRVHEVLLLAGYKKHSNSTADRDAAIFTALDGGKSLKALAFELNLSVNRLKLIVAGRNAQALPKVEQDEVFCLAN